MFDKISIDGFRGLDQVEVGPLGRVNLLVGPGGSGKTSLLEAVFIHSDVGNVNLFNVALDQRCIPLDMDRPEEMSRLYDGYFSIKATRERAFKIRAAWAGEPRSTEGWIETGSALASSVNRLAPASSARVSPGFTPRVYSILTNWSKKHLQGTGQMVVHAQGIDQKSPQVPGVPVWLLGIKSITLSAVDLAAGWTAAEDAGEADAIKELLRKVDPAIRDVRVAARPDNQASLRITHEPAGTIVEPALLGSWLPRACVLGTMISKASDGVLLVDEWDAMLHVSALQHVARYLLDAARRRNVQLFLCTHRLEAAYAFLDLADAPDDVRVIRSRREEGRISFETIDAEQARFLRDDVGIDIRWT